MATIIDVANWFLSKESMTHKKLQKLCYYYIAWGHALFNREMAEGAFFEAWVHGPISPLLYAQFRDFGWNLIPQRECVLEVFTEEQLYLLESVYLTYGPLSANELGALSHSELPWKKARGFCPPNIRSQQQISPEDMRDYYRSIYEQSQGE